MSQVEIQSASPGTLARIKREGFRTPIVLDGLFKDSPGGQIRSSSQAARAFGDVNVSLVRDYNAFLEEAIDAQAYTAPLGKVAMVARAHEKLPFYVSEMDTPPPVREQFSEPSAFKSRFERVVSKMFLSGKGSIPPCHFDGDYRNVFLYQVFGKKRIVVFPPRASAALCPFFNFSALRMGATAWTARKRLAEAFGGSFAEIDAGQALLIPRGYWHSVEYATSSMSLNFRFGRSVEHFLATALPSTHRIPILFEAISGPRAVKEIAALLRVYYAPYANARERHLAFSEQTSAALSRHSLGHFSCGMVDALDLESNAVRGLITVAAGKLKDYDFQVRLQGDVLTKSARMPRAARSAVAEIKRRAGAGIFRRWTKLIGLPDDVDALDNFGAAMLLRLEDYGLSDRDPRAAPKGDVS